MRPEWVSFQGQNLADGRKFLPKNLQMGVNFWPKASRWAIILIRKTSRLVTISIIPPRNGWFSCKLNKTYRNSAKFGSCFVVHSLGMGLFLFIDGPASVCGWVNFPIVWLHTPVQKKLQWPPGDECKHFAGEGERILIIHKIQWI